MSVGRDNTARHQFNVSGTLARGEVVTLGREISHRIKRVLRLEAGDGIVLVDGQRQRFSGTLLSVGDNIVMVMVDAVLETRGETSLELVLAQGLPKGDKLETIIQKSAEMGVHSVVPLITSRTVPHLSREKVQNRLQRWQRIAHEAAQQSRREAVTAVETPQSLKEWILAGVQGPLVVLWEGEEKTGLKAALRTLKTEISRVTLLIGPEGGWEPGEIEFICRSGGLTASLGAYILRTETAALVAVALTMYELGTLGGGFPA